MDTEGYDVYIDYVKGENSGLFKAIERNYYSQKELGPAFSAKSPDDLILEGIEYAKIYTPTKYGQGPGVEFSEEANKALSNVYKKVLEHILF